MIDRESKILGTSFQLIPTVGIMFQARISADYQKNECIS